MDATLWKHADAIVFDAFGTLVEIADKRAPIRALLARATGPTRAELAWRVMRAPLDWSALIAAAGLQAHPDIPALTQDLDAEIASIRACAYVHDIWPALAWSGKRIGVCSNLALPYIAPCQAALPQPVHAAVWSCHTGAIKPEPLIYLTAAQAVQAPVERVLFVGDRALEDQDGPRAVGMMAAPIHDFVRWIQQAPGTG